MNRALSVLATGVLLLGAMLSTTARAQDENPGAKPNVNGPDATASAGGGGDWTAHGAQIARPGDKILDLGLGWPALRAGFHIPVNSWFEVEPNLTFFYGRDFHIAVGDTFGVKLKFKVFQKDRLAISLEADPALILYYPAGYYSKPFGVGIQLGRPELTRSYEVISKLWLVFGLDMPIAIAVHPFTAASIPILFKFGGEYGVNDKLHLFAIFEAGPDIITAGGGVIGATLVTGAFNALLGLAYNF